MSSERGTSAIEAALLAALFIPMFLVSADVVSLLRTKLRLDQVSGNLARNVTEYQKLYNDDVSSLFDSAQIMAGNTQVTGAGGATIITAMSNVQGTTTVVWRKVSPNNTTNFTSSFGAVNATPKNLPDDYVLPTDTSMIAIEVFSTAKTWVLSESIMGTVVGPMRAVALFHPRSTVLPQLVAANRP